MVAVGASVEGSLNVTFSTIDITFSTVGGALELSPNI